MYLNIVVVIFILSADMREENILNIKKPNRKYFRHSKDRSPLVNTTVCLFYTNDPIQITKSNTNLAKYKIKQIPTLVVYTL